MDKYIAEQFNLPVDIDPRPCPFEFHEPEAAIILQKVFLGSGREWWVRENGDVLERKAGLWFKLR